MSTETSMSDGSNNNTESLNMSYESSTAHTGGEFSDSSINININNSEQNKRNNHVNESEQSSDMNRYSINTSDINMISE